MSQFAFGSHVQDKSRPTRIGVVLELDVVCAGDQYYQVCWNDGARTTIGESDLRAYYQTTSPHENLQLDQIGGFREFQRLLTFTRLAAGKPLSKPVAAFTASRTRFMPHQFIPLLKFIDSPHHRLLIADEVGLGKTIEAGLILTELKARQPMQRVLVVCPAALTTKWKLELVRRFDETFLVYNSLDFQQLLNSYSNRPAESSFRAILSFESVRQQALIDLIEVTSPQLDLVIIDEAHHLRNYGTKQRKAAQLLSECADAMVLLTATPVQIGRENLHSLLNVLDPEEFADSDLSESRFQTNESIVLAQNAAQQFPPNLQACLSHLQHVKQSQWISTNPLYSDLCNRLEQFIQSARPIDFQSTLTLQSDLSSLNLIAHIFSRTKKRSVQAGQVIRKAHHIEVEFSEIEMRFYNAVTALVRAEAARSASSPLVQQWMLNTPQRRLASSIPAMVEYYKTHLDDLAWDQDEDSVYEMEEHFDSTVNEVDTTRLRHNLAEMLSDWPINGPDTKYETLKKTLEHARLENPERRVLLFAFFKGTLHYLYRKLRSDGFLAEIVTGDTPPSDRIDIIQRTSEEKNFVVLLMSRVGSEGLDFQFADTLVNYDLPWNPMDIEQRIGRLDRIGQESDVITIINLWAKGTIEERILRRLLDRIQIFERSVGDLEAILGDELHELERLIFSQNLSEVEEEARVSQAELAITNNLQLAKKMEIEGARFIGTDQFFTEEINRLLNQRKHVTGEQLRLFFQDFVTENCPSTRLEYDVHSQISLLHPDENLRRLILQSPDREHLKRFLHPPEKGIKLTFDSNTAFRDQKMEFVTVLHPLTRLMVNHYERDAHTITTANNLSLTSDLLPCGLYFYFIFGIHINAARPRNTLELVVIDQSCSIVADEDRASMLLGDMLEKGGTPLAPNWTIPEAHVKAAFAAGKECIARRIGLIREDLNRNNNAFLDSRLNSLEAFFTKRINAKKELLERAYKESKESRYTRMLEGTIRNLISEKDNKLRELNQQRQITIDYREIACGLLLIESEG